MARVLLIHWNAEEAAELAAPLRAAGVEVWIEAHDGGAAVKRIVADPPDQVLISLDRLPSHGRTVAQHLGSLRSPRPTAGARGRGAATPSRLTAPATPPAP